MPFLQQLRASILFVLLLSIAASVKAQSLSRIDDWLDRHAQDMGGRALLMIYKDGQVVYSNSVNDMSRRQKIATRFIARRQGKEADNNDFSPASRIPLASCSKWYSAALVMSFVDEGKLSLTDTIGRWLPAMSASSKGGITISQCLSHLTGIKAPELKESLEEMRGIGSMQEAVEQIAQLPMEGQPGEVFRYSNTGLQLAGAVLEKISGQSFETLFAQRIALPLEMKNTDFGKGKVALPAGGAQGTADDYLHFLTMILQHGMYNGKRILSEESIRQMQINRIGPDVTIAYSPTEAGDFGYGFGEWVMERSTANNLTKAVTSPGLFGSFPWVDNERKYCAILLSYNLKSKGRHERYKELKALVDQTLH